MKRSVVILLLLALLGVPRYAQAELSAPTGVRATEGTYSNAIIISWNPVAGATNYEIWRDDYSGCIEQLPCEPEFIYWRGVGHLGTKIVDFFLEDEWDLYYDVVFEYKIKSLTESSISDFSLPAYGYISKEGALYSVNPTPVDLGIGGGGGGGGIFGDILKSSVIGYHFDGFTKQGVQVYMPVTQGFKALKGTQEYVRSFAPALAKFVRECFDCLEQKADANKESFLYNFGTHLFQVLGKIAEGCLRLLGQEDYMNDAYESTTIGVEEFKKLKSEGSAIAPKIVKEVMNLEQEEGLLSLMY